MGRKCGLDLFTSAHLLLHWEASVEGDWREPLHIIHRQAEAEALKFQHGHQAFGSYWELNQMDKKRSWGLTSKVLSCIFGAFIQMAEKLGEVEGKGHQWGHQSILSFQDRFTLSYKYLPGPAEDKELNEYKRREREMNGSSVFLELRLQSCRGKYFIHENVWDQKIYPNFLHRVHFPMRNDF